MKKFFSFICIFGFLSLTQAQYVDLALKLEQGKTYSLTTSTKTTHTQKIAGMEMNFETISSNKMTYKVTAIYPDYYDMDVSYNYLRLKVNLLGSTIDMSSDINEINNKQSQLISKMTEYTFQMKISKKGELLEIKGLDDFIDSLLSSVYEMSDTALSQMKTQILDSYGSKAIQKNILYTIFPKNPVKKGDTWTTHTSLNSIIPFEIKYNNILTKISPLNIVIQSNTTMESKGKSDLLNNSKNSMDYEFSGIIISYLKLNRKSGWIKKGTVIHKLDGNIGMNAGEDEVLNFKMPFTILSETIITNK